MDGIGIEIGFGTRDWGLRIQKSSGLTSTGCQTVFGRAGRKEKSENCEWQGQAGCKGALSSGAGFSQKSGDRILCCHIFNFAICLSLIVRLCPIFRVCWCLAISCSLPFSSLPYQFPVFPFSATPIKISCVFVCPLMCIWHLAKWESGQMIRIYGKFVERFVSIYMSAKAKWPLKSATWDVGLLGCWDGSWILNSESLCPKSSCSVNDTQPDIMFSFWFWRTVDSGQDGICIFLKAILATFSTDLWMGLWEFVLLFFLATVRCS